VCRCFLQWYADLECLSHTAALLDSRAGAGAGPGTRKLKTRSASACGVGCDALAQPQLLRQHQKGSKPAGRLPGRNEEMMLDGQKLMPPPFNAPTIYCSHLPANLVKILFVCIVPSSSPQSLSLQALSSNTTRPASHGLSHLF
jgi:hypothetical protein